MQLGLGGALAACDQGKRPGRHQLWKRKIPAAEGESIGA